MNLNQITLPSLNIQESIDFYTILGLKLIVHTHDRYARFHCQDGDATLSVHLVEEMPEGHRTIIYFEREDLKEYVELLKQKGIKFESSPQDQSWLWTESRLSDPHGNPIIIYKAGKNRVDPPWRKKD